MPCQLLCPVTYQFVDYSEEVKERVSRIEAKDEKEMRLTEKGAKVIEDMAFGRDLGPYIDKNVKLVYNGKRLVLREINPHFFLHILKILQANMRVWGKTIFEMLAFTL